MNEQGLEPTQAAENGFGTRCCKDVVVLPFILLLITTSYKKHFLRLAT